MKKLFVNPIIVLTFLASMMFVSSCEESADVVEADLIGTWAIENVSVDVKVGPVKLKEFLMSSLSFGKAAAEELVDEITSEFLDIKGGTVTFNSDYSCLMKRSGIETNGTWSLEGDKLYLNISDDMVNEDPLTVRSMNSSDAVVAMEKEQELPLEEGISTPNATIIIELNLNKK